MITSIILFLLLLLPAISFFSSIPSLFNRSILRREQPENAQGNEGNDEGEGDSSDTEAATFEPTPMDVLIVRAMLQKALELPIEVILLLLDLAEYWPHTTSILDNEVVIRAGDPNRENRFLLRTTPLGLVRIPHYDKTMYTRTPVQPQTFSSEDPEYSVEQFQQWIGTNTVIHPCRKIVFTIHSHDQGFCPDRADKGTFRNSWTWFEAGLERFDSNSSPEKSGEVYPSQDPEAQASSSGDVSGPSFSHPCLPVSSLRSVLPEIVPGEGWRFEMMPNPNMTIQHNVTAVKKTKAHRVQWSWTDNDFLSPDQLKDMGRGHHTANGEFVRHLKLGDVVSVWAKARFPAWVNTVESIKVDVYWAL